MSIALHAACFDASALIKRYMDETGSQELRRYWCAQPTKYTTPFCFYETLSVLKGHRRRGTLTKDHYLRAASDLVAWFGASHSQIYDIEFTRADVFHDARELAERYDVDLADAFLLLSLQAGYFSVFVGGSKTLLVTADEPLANAARHMQLPVWDCMREPNLPNRARLTRWPPRASSLHSGRRNERSWIACCRPINEGEYGSVEHHPVTTVAASSCFFPCVDEIVCFYWPICCEQAAQGL